MCVDDMQSENHPSGPALGHWMGNKRWLRKYGHSLTGKTVAVTGPTGGLGVPLCRMLLQCGAALILMGRNPQKTEDLEESLKKEFPAARISRIPLNLADMESVKKACSVLERSPLHLLYHNAGVYAVPPVLCSTGYHQVFQINFVSPYYMTKRLLPHLAKNRGKVIAVGSVAHTYACTEPENPDFSGKSVEKMYGNSKRYLMFGLEQLMEKQRETEFAIAHPGLAFTDISNHFSDRMYKLLKLPMKMIYMKPDKSARSLLCAAWKTVPSGYWIGPWLFHIWGNPRVSRLHTCSRQERQKIGCTAEKIYSALR